MNKLRQFLIIFGLFVFVQIGFSQMAAVKNFDYSLLEGKKLYLPTYEASKSYIERMGKKGKFDKVTKAKNTASNYNNAWKGAMAESSYDATDYEIRAFDRKELIKSKNKEAILLYYMTDEHGNESAILMVTSPKRKVIARTIITGLDLTSKNDIRLMMNMLNESLNTAAEAEEEGDKSRGNIKNKYKQNLVDFHDEIDTKTFLVPKSEHKNPKKAAARTADLKEALKLWRLSKYRLTTNAEIEKQRIEGDPESYYWKDFPVYTRNILITYHYNVILSTDGDNVIFAFLGNKRLKPATLEEIQRKVVARAAKYKSQLEN